MQLTTIPAGAVPLHPPIGSRPGMPTRESVIAPGYTPSSGRFPGTGLGLGGWLLPTDDYLRLFLGRPELALMPESCPAERALHAALLASPSGLATQVPTQVSAPAAPVARSVISRWGVALP